MKKTKFGFFGIVAITVGLFAFSNMEYGSVKGTVSPQQGALRAWVLSAKDTFKADVIEGTFEIKYVKNGTYRLVIEAKPPYKNALKEGITVLEGSQVDVGEIVLQQQANK